MYIYIFIYIYHKNLNSVRLSKVLIFDEKMKENGNVYACFEKEAFKNRKSFFMKNLYIYKYDFFFLLRTLGLKLIKPHTEIIIS